MNTRKLFTQALCLLSCFFLAPQLQAQTKLWGHGTTNGAADAEFQNTFLQSNAGFPYSTTQWTAQSISENDGTVTPGAAYWTRTTTGLSQGGYATNMVPASSATASNGIAIFDSDFMDNAGTAGAFGTGTSVSPHHGELISPRIDLTGATDSALSVSFYSYYRFFRITELSVSMSVDDGLSWTTIGDMTALQAGSTNNAVEGRINVLVPNITTGVGNLSQCRLKFTFNGRYYYAIVDDITIEMAPEYNMEIGVADANGPTYFSVGNIIRMGGEFVESYWNIDYNNPVGWSWGAKVVNKGYRDIPPSANPRLICRVDAVDLGTGIRTIGVYRDTIISTDSILSNSPNGTAIETDMTAADLNFIRQQTRGTRVSYEVAYWVEHDNVDGGTENDTIEYNFVIEHNTPDPVTSRFEKDYTSKARYSNADGRVFARTSIFPGGSPHSSFEYGSVFYFPRGATDGVTIDSIDFRYRLANGFTGAANQTILANVYRYQDGTNGGTANGFIVGEELTLVGINTAALTGLGTAAGIPAGDYGLATFPAPVDASTGAPMGALVDGGFYYISIQVNPSLTGGAATFGVNDVPLHGVDNLNYAMNIGKTTTTAPFAASTMRVIDAAGTENWYAGFTGFDETPSIGVFFSSGAPVTVNNLPNTLEGQLSLYPNPATEVLQVEVQLENTADVQYIITDVSGRVVYYDKSNQVNQEIVTVDVSNLAAGVYMVTAQTQQGVTTQKFVKK